MLRYVCIKTWNSNGCWPSLRTFMTVCRLPGPRVTLYTRPKSCGHALRASALRFDEYRPKSSLTQSSDGAPDLAAPDSDVLLPRNSHRDERAKPCCDSADVAWSAGGGPKTYCH